MRLPEQPAPKDFLHFHRAEDPDADAIIYTLIGRDDERKEAYYMRGRWGFGEQPPMPGAPVIEA
jgi:hypothetical protein